MLYRELATRRLRATLPVAAAPQPPRTSTRNIPSVDCGCASFRCMQWAIGVIQRMSQHKNELKFASVEATMLGAVGAGQSSQVAHEGGPGAEPAVDVLGGDHPAPLGGGAAGQAHERHQWF